MLLMGLSFIAGFVLTYFLLGWGGGNFELLRRPPWIQRISIFEWLSQNKDLESEIRTKTSLPDENQLKSKMSLAPGTLDSLQLRDGFEENKIALNRFNETLLKVLEKFRNKDKILLYELLCTECLLIYLPYLVDQQEDLRKYKFLQQTADWLCYKSSDRGPIKIGLILQGLSPQPHIQNIITLGCHDETAYWAGIALRLSETDSDQGLFQIMSSLQGWGRIQCIRLLSENPNTEIKKWLLAEGYKNNILFAESILDIWHFSKPLETFNSQPEIDINVCLGLLEIYQVMLTQIHPLQLAQCHGFEELLIVLTNELSRMQSKNKFSKDMMKNLSTYNSCRAIQMVLNESFMDVPPFNGLDFTVSEVKNILKCFVEIIDNDISTWKAVIDKELFKDSMENYAEACSAANELGMDIWPLHQQRLINDPRNPLLWSALCSTNDMRRAVKCIDIAVNILPLNEIATGPKNQHGIPPGSQSHYCLQILLSHMQNFPGKGRELIMAGLRSPLIINRLTAMQTLDCWRDMQWEDFDSYSEILSNALKCEIEPSLNLRLQNLCSNRHMEEGIDELDMEPEQARQYLLDDRGIKYWEPNN
ncbi:MAG: hypothetical protein VX619_02500 [bacterium]|nr:hypothetical protein [bacterium]